VRAGVRVGLRLELLARSFRVCLRVAGQSASRRWWRDATERRSGGEGAVKLGDRPRSSVRLPPILHSAQAPTTNIRALTSHVTARPASTGLPFLLHRRRAVSLPLTRVPGALPFPKLSAESPGPLVRRALTLGGVAYAVFKPVEYHQGLIPPSVVAPQAGKEVHPSTVMAVRQLGSCERPSTLHAVHGVPNEC